MSTESVKRHLAEFGVAERARFLPGSIATVGLAAAALGVEPDRIAKTFAIRIKGTERVLVIVAKGTARLDNAKFKKAFQGKAAFVSGDECLSATGHPPGGVCPFGLAEEVKVYLDDSLKEFSTVYPAAGSPENCVEATPEELASWTGGEWIDVCI